MTSGVRHTIDRNYSLDLLRILSMFGIVLLHSGSHGGTLAISEGLNIYTLMFHGIESLAISSVNVFILISGYFLCNQSFRLSRIFSLVLTVVFYSLLGVAIAAYVNDDVFSVKVFIKSLFPVSYVQYWFISAYIVMCLLSPLINFMVKGMTRRQHLLCIILLLLVFCIWPDIMIYSYPSGVKNVGSSALWFFVLYIVAAYIKRWKIVYKPIRTIGIYFVSSAALLAIWSILVIVTKTTDFKNEADGLVTFYYYRYNSLLVFIASVSLFIGFLNLNIKRTFFKKVIRVVAPLMLGVYLIHDNNHFRGYVWSGLRGLEPSLFSPFFVIGYALIVFGVCAFLDFIRMALFGVIDKRIWYRKCMDGVDLIPDYIETKLEILFNRQDNA